MGDRYVGGTFNTVGVRPGNGFSYDGPTMPHMVYFSLTFTSTYEVIERYILPPPLKADRDLPPTVRISYFINADNRAYDGNRTPYQAVILNAAVRHREITGFAGYEYVDGVDGDKTEMDVMGSWSVYFGMLKKFADIRFRPIGIDEFEATVTRRGTRLVTMRLRGGPEMSEKELHAHNAFFAESGRSLTVREIPNADFTGLIEQSVCVAPTDNGGITLKRVRTAEPISLEFGHLPQDPLDEIPIFSLDSAMIFEQSVTSESFGETRIAELLAADPIQAPVNQVPWP